MRDAKGNLYGTTEGGENLAWGTVFRLTPTGKETVLYNFKGGADGGAPRASLVRDSAGNLYGTTSGADSFGNVFKVSPTGKETVLFSFDGGAQGAVPLAKVIRNEIGNLYGVTENGGAYGCGVVFMIEPSGQETVLWAFTGVPDGCQPVGDLRMDSQGNIYGTTKGGGTSGYGAVFKRDALTYAETVVYSFAGSPDGAGPAAGLFQETGGNLYGTTEWGGDLSCGQGCGVVFKVDTTGQEFVLYSFTGGNDGGYPVAGLIKDEAGNLYGTTYSGGAWGMGVIFKLAPGVETVLHTFTGIADGGGPAAGLIQDTAGNLYGTTSAGGDLSWRTVLRQRLRRCVQNNALKERNVMNTQVNEYLRTSDGRAARPDHRQRRKPPAPMPRNRVEKCMTGKS